MSKFFRVLNLIIKESETFNLRFYTKNLETITSFQFKVENSISTLNGQTIDDILIPATVTQVILIDKNGGSKFVNLKMISFKFPNPSFTKLILTVNPYQIAPLTSLVQYATDQDVNFKYTVIGQDGEDFESALDCGGE